MAKGEFAHGHWELEVVRLWCFKNASDATDVVWRAGAGMAFPNTL